MSPVGTNHEVKVNLDLLGATGLFTSVAYFKPGVLFVEVGASQLVIEKQLDIWHRLENVKQSFVKIRTIHREDGLRESV